MYNHLNILEFSHDLNLVFNQCSNVFCTKTSQNQNFSGSFGASNHNGISVVSLDHGTMRVCWSESCMYNFIKMTLVFDTKLTKVANFSKNSSRRSSTIRSKSLSNLRTNKHLPKLQNSASAKQKRQRFRLNYSPPTQNQPFMTKLPQAKNKKNSPILIKEDVGTRIHKTSR